MRTQIKIYDTRLENIPDTITVKADITPPGPLRAVFAVDSAMSATYTDYDGLLKTMQSICKNWGMVRKLKIEVELENEDDNHSR